MTTTEVSVSRLYAMRALYLALFIFLSSQIWPQLLHHPMEMHGAATSLLGAIAVLAVLGLRYPLQMLPLLLYELVWKSIWLIAIALPLWLAHRIDADAAQTVKACLVSVVLFPLIIPWPYVFANYVKRPADRWR